MAGTCLVTGAIAGIGAETARELARRGAEVVIVGRRAERCAATTEAIRRQTGNPSVGFIAADRPAGLAAAEDEPVIESIVCSELPTGGDVA